MGKEHDLKRKMHFYQNVQRIVDSLKMIAAVRSRRFSSRYKIISKFNNNTAHNCNTTILLNPKAEISLNILFGAEKGLCGNYVSNLGKLIQEKVVEKSDHSDNCEKWIFIGNKLPIHTNQIPVKNILHRYPLSISYPKILQIATQILDMSNDIKQISCYAWHANSIAPSITILHSNQIAEENNQQLIYSNEQFSEKILYDLHLSILMGQIFEYMTSSIMMEERARLYAMDQAVKNADNMIIELKRKYNQERQQTITNEINEIISGCEYI